MNQEPPMTGTSNKASVFAAAVARFFKNLSCNLLAGVRAALLLRTNLEYLRVSALQVAALVLGLLLPPLVEQFLLVGLHGQFSSYGIPGAVVIFSFGFLVAAVMATFSQQRGSLGALLIIFLAAAIVIDTVSIALPYLLQAAKLKAFYGSYYEIFSRASSYWLALAAAVAWARLLATSRLQLRLISFFSALLIIVLLENSWWDRTLWTPASDEAQSAEYLERYEAPVREEVLYLQPELLAKALDKLQPATDTERAHLYFLGFAPYASQNVFMREINTVTSLFETRFAASERSLTLINNAQTVRTVPLATKTALGLALQRFGKVMNAENDVLFLYLTSHGSREHHLSIEFMPLRLDDLTPADVKKMLDDAGIKWRVIAISACYSGGFIDALKSDDTLIMTAAASDKTSFGCSDEESFTYFGKAYFDEALRQTYSFTDAFHKAKVSVTAREKAQGFESSNPQIALGSAIENKLREFEKQYNSSSEKVLDSESIKATEKTVSEKDTMGESNHEAVAE